MSEGENQKNEPAQNSEDWAEIDPSVKPSESSTATITSTIEYGKARNGDSMLARVWKPRQKPKAVLLMNHGIAEHTGRYGNVGGRFAENGFYTIAWDMRGHGRSGGRRNHIEKFSFFLDDVEDQITRAKNLDLPLVLLGHSLGGLISTKYCSERHRPQPDLLVLSAPGFDAHVPQWQRFIVGKLAQLAPKLFLKPAFEPSMLSRDEMVCSEYSEDPLIKPGGTAMMLTRCFEAMAQASDAVTRVDQPALVLHGDEDRLVPTACSEIVEGLSNFERRVLKEIRHEILFEPEGLQYVDDICVWIEAKLKEL